jgi:hypothetical protein
MARHSVIQVSRRARPENIWREIERQLWSWSSVRRSQYDVALLMKRRSLEYLLVDAGSPSMGPKKYCCIVIEKRVCNWSNDEDYTCSSRESQVDTLQPEASRAWRVRSYQKGGWLCGTALLLNKKRTNQPSAIEHGILQVGITRKNFKGILSIL